MTWQKFIALFDTDPLALGAIAGLLVTIVVSIGVFAFMLTRKNTKQIPKA